MLGSTVRSLVGESWHELLRTNGQPKSDVCGYCENANVVDAVASPRRTGASDLPSRWLLGVGLPVISASVA